MQENKDIFRNLEKMLQHSVILKSLILTVCGELLVNSKAQIIIYLSEDMQFELI